MLHLFQLEHYEPARLRVWVERRGARVDWTLLVACLRGRGAAHRGRRGGRRSCWCCRGCGAGVGLARRAATASSAARRPSRSCSPPARGGCSCVALAIPALVLAGRGGRRARRRPAPGWPPRSAPRPRSSASSPRPELLFAANAAVRPDPGARQPPLRAPRAAASSPRSTRSWSGITGSFGKTTTKVVRGGRGRAARPRVRHARLLQHLPRAWSARSTRGSAAKHREFIVEMGAYRLGDVAELCELVHPRIGMLTAIGPAHLERFGSLDAIEQAKGELAEALPADGVYITNADDERCLRSGGADPGARGAVQRGRRPERGPDRPRHRDGRGNDPLHARAHAAEEAVVRSKLLGRHNVANLLAAAAVGIEPRPSARRDRPRARPGDAARPPARADPQSPGRHRRDRRRLQLEPGRRRGGARGARLPPGGAAAARDARHGRAGRARGRGERALRHPGGGGLRPRGARRRGALAPDPRRPDRRRLPRIADPRGRRLLRGRRRCSPRRPAAATWCSSRTTSRISIPRTATARGLCFRANDAAGSSGRRPVRRPLR